MEVAHFAGSIKVNIKSTALADHHLFFVYIIIGRKKYVPCGHVLILSQNTCVLSGSNPTFDVPFLNPAQHKMEHLHIYPTCQPPKGNV